MKLSTHDWYFIANALRVAGEVYTQDADTVMKDGNAELAKTFLAQANRAGELADEIEEQV